MNTIVLSLSFFFRPPGFRTNVINIIFLTSECFNRNSMQERRGKYGEGIFFKFYNMGQIEIYSLFNTVTKVFLSLYLLISDYNYKKMYVHFFT